MSQVFCTLKEAARTLNANEDEIQALVARGVLQEFRDGPHRLLKEADVGALALKCRQRRADPPSSPARTRTSVPSGRRKTEDRGPKTEDRKHQTDDQTAASAVRHPPSSTVRPPSSARRPPSSVRREPSSGIPNRPAERSSLRQWLWTGLVQDRPAAIALLAGLVLLLLSALVAGVCLAAEGL